MFNLTNEPAEKLAESLVKISPGMYKVFYSDNGSSADGNFIKTCIAILEKYLETKRKQKLQL